MPSASTIYPAIHFVDVSAGMPLCDIGGLACVPALPVQRLFNEIEPDSSLVVGAIVRILDAKSPDRAVMIKVPIEEFQQYVERYRFELAFEEIHRKTDITYNPATLDTILTEREITTWKKGENEDDDSSD